MSAFVKAIVHADLTAGQGVMVELLGKKIAIFNVDETFYAVDDICTHAGGPLSEGELEETKITCPWHGATFDIKTGLVLSPPAAHGVRSYEVKSEGEDVLVKVV